jgi:dienelactone hydrolase
MIKRVLMTTVMAVAMLSGHAVAGDSETITVQSSNPFDYVHIVDGSGPGGDVTIEADLVFPDGVDPSKKVPAMIFVHGSGGKQGRHQKWLSLFRELGIATVYADHFAPRGASSTVGNQSKVTGAAMTADALNLLNALANHPRIDASKIGIMGASKGGGVATYVAWNPITKAIAGDSAFAAFIPLYPPCVRFEKKDMSKAPMLMMLGDSDNYTGVSQCVASVRELQVAGFDNLTVKSYAGAYHAFDDDRGIRSLDDGYNLTGCKFLIRADGTTIEEKSGLSLAKPSNRRSAFGGCISKGVTLGGYHVMDEATADVRAFITKALLN